MVFLNRYMVQINFKFFKDGFPKGLFDPFLNALSHMQFHMVLSLGVGVGFGMKWKY